MASDGEGEIFAIRVDFFVHDRSENCRLTKYHAKLAHYRALTSLAVYLIVDGAGGPDKAYET